MYVVIVAAPTSRDEDGREVEFGNMRGIMRVDGKPIVEEFAFAGETLYGFSSRDKAMSAVDQIGLYPFDVDILEVSS